MKKVALFMSDFHLGQKDRMEEFHADEEFAELLGRLSHKHADDEVDLVLLGDVMDLWTTIPASERQEVNAQTAKQINLYLPVMNLDDRNDKEAAFKKEKEKIEAIAAAHPLFFESLFRFLNRDSSKRRIVYVPGNHDHSVVDHSLQALVKDKILQHDKNPSQAQRQAIEQRIVFSLWYGDEQEHNVPLLQVYAEHGNQLTYKGIFRYADYKAPDQESGASRFAEFGVECPGYVQFRLVSNRLERRSPELNSVFMEFLEPSMWPGVLFWLLVKGKILLLRKARIYKLQYEKDAREAVQWARRQLPPAWKTFFYMLWNRYLGLTRDEYGRKLLLLFDQGAKKTSAEFPLSGTTLDPKQTKTLILGHTHQSRDVDLPGLDGVKYYNTGSWILRYENERHIIEQTWVTVSAEIGGRGDGRPRIIEREMVRRNVELAQVGASPVTTDGQSLNPVMREMTDLQVGDVVLFHWNFGATIKRLVTSPRHWWKLATEEIPHMVMSWINRYGTGSYWSHVALVYASPSEKEEAGAYGDPLFLEAIPESGVAINGPKHYLAYRAEWDIAILRSRAGWLLDKWENRRLLRRLALGALQSHYDQQGVGQLTLLYAGRTMDAVRGNVIVGAMVKGAISGLVLLGLWLLCVAAMTIYKAPDGIRGLWKTIGATLQSAFSRANSFLDNSDLLFFKWGPIIKIHTESADWSLHLAAALLLAIQAGILLFLAGWLAWVTVRILMYATALYGAAWGVLLVPPLAELSGGWRKLSIPTRWIATGLWVLLALLVLSLERGLDDFQNGYSLSRDVAIGVEVLGTIFLAGATLIVWIASLAIPFMQWHRARQGSANQEPTPSDKAEPHEPQFICSTLVQDALLRAADQVDSAKRDDVNVTPPGEAITLPKHFATSEKKFDWIYLLTRGVVSHRPGAVQREQVTPGESDEENWALSRRAQFSLLIGLPSLLLVFRGDLFRVTDESHWYGLVWIALSLGLVAIGLGRLGAGDVAVDPIGKRGAILAFWGEFLGAAALIGAIVAIFSLGDAEVLLLSRLWFVLPSALLLALAL